MIEILRVESLQENQEHLRETIAYMRKRKGESYGEEHKYFDTAIVVLQEKQHSKEAEGTAYE